MIHEPHTDLSDLAGEILNLNTVELTYIDLEQFGNVQQQLTRLLLHSENIQLKQTQALIGDNEEVAAAAGWVKEFQLTYLW